MEGCSNGLTCCLDLCICHRVRQARIYMRRSSRPPDVLRDGGAANVLVFGYCVGDIYRLYGWPSYRTTTRPLVHRGEGSHGSVPPPPELLSGGPTGSKEAVAVGGGCPTREQ